MALTAEVYRGAAHDRVQDAVRMYDAEHYGAAHYLAGVAVECMLYACRIKAGGQLDKQHQLINMWEDAKLAVDLPRTLKEEAGAALTTVAARWLNNHRYRSDRELRRWLGTTGIARSQGSKADPLQHSARLITSAAHDFVRIGEQQWQLLQTLQSKSGRS